MSIRTICLSLVLLAPAVVTAAEAPTGQRIYAQKCAKCHGDQGQGVPDGHDKPLVGDRSVAELTKLIAETMPEDKPGTCTRDDARSVAAYIHEAFYSPLAQERIRPARVELSRLTVRQYRQSLADLVGAFRWSQTWDGGGGLKGGYYDSRRFVKKDLVFDRIDGQVAFDFGDASPEHETLAYDQFAVRWTGGLLAPEAGEYEIILESQNGAELFLNDMERPLIDAAVQSGDDTVHRATIRLLDGHVYPLRIDFFKLRHAVVKTAAITLKWRMPRREIETIPARYLSPRDYPSVYVCDTPFPPDDRSVGYERGTSISKAWDQATTDSAIDAATFVVGHLKQLSNVSASDPKRVQKLKEFGYRWVSRVFRQPISDEMKRAYVDRWFDESPDPEMAVKRVVLLTLMSPRFLYQDVGEPNDTYSVAARMAMTAWDGLPDEGLLHAAKKDLKNPDSVRWHAERMADDLRTSAKLREFFVQWLKVDRFTDLAKDAKRFPDFDEQVVSDLRTALDLFLDDTVLTKEAEYRQLLLADWLYMNGSLAKLYGAKLPEDAPFQKVTIDGGQRAGVLTHPYLMAGLSYTSKSSPIHRGVFVARSVLGRSLRPPPEAVTPLPPELHADLSTRERIALQTKSEACQSCHRMINPLGFAFENFDAIGRYRKQEEGRAIDTTGLYQTRDGQLVKFANIRELATFLADSDETHTAFVEQLFHYLVKQPIRAYGPQTLASLNERFATNHFNLRKLVVDIIVTSALHPRVDPFSRDAERALAPHRG